MINFFGNMAIAIVMTVLIDHTIPEEYQDLFTVALWVLCIYVCFVKDSGE